MGPNNQYEIIIKKKIPYVSEFLLGILSLCMITLAICFFLFIPALRSSNEMKVVATITTIPENVKWLILFSGIGLLIFWFLYKYLSFYKAGLFSFSADTFTLSDNKIISQIPISNISKIELIDPVDYKDDFKGKFIIVIYNRNAETLRFQLKEYNDCFNFINHLAGYDSLRDRIKNLNKSLLSESTF